MDDLLTAEAASPWQQTIRQEPFNDKGLVTAAVAGSFMGVYPAARVTDALGHGATLEGILAGVAVGVLVATAIVATGGLGAVAVGAALATTGAAGMAGAAIGNAMAGPVTGRLTTGSPNVFINGLPATMVGLATGCCATDGPSPHVVATGAATVFINGRPAARITDQLNCGAIIRTGSPNVFIGGPTGSPLCALLRDERKALERFAIDAQAASAAYDPPDTRQPPDGYRNATAEDLRKLRLNEGMLEHPKNRTTGKPSDFRAAVFINKATGAPIVAFKGTSSAQDWAANVQQGLGHETFYYDQAQRISRRVAGSPDGAGARLTGHSLGGGMASAGAEASGLPATTFNAAGLNAQTVPHPVHADIDAVYVQGEALRATQSIPGMPRSTATRTWPLPPAGFWVGLENPSWKVKAASTLRASYLGALMAIGSVLLHFMDNVDAALAQKQAANLKALEDNRCL